MADIDFDDDTPEFIPLEDCPSDCYDLDRHCPSCQHAPDISEEEL